MRPFYATLRLFLFVCLAFLGWQAQAAFIVSGAGDADANGLYAEYGLVDGVPAFRKEGGAQTWYLKRCYGNWFLEPYESCFGMYYRVTSADDVPPETGWGGWQSPAPTVLPAGPVVSFSSKTLFESLRNDGRFDDSLLINHNLLDGDGFNGTAGDNLLQQGNAILANLPAGLTASLVVNNSSELELRISGSALSSSQADTVTDLTLQLLDAAFISGDASANINAEVGDLTLQFRDLHTVGSSGDFATIAAAVAAAEPYDILQLAAETFTEKNITINKALVIRGAGADQTIIQAMEVPQSETGRIFSVNSGLPETHISDLTLRNGNATGGNSYGGAIQAQSSLVLQDCRFTNNRNESTFIGGGGAVNSNASLIINRCLFDGNSAHRTSGGQVWGGAIRFSGTALITNSTFYNNSLTAASPSTSTRGGAISPSSGSTLVLINSTLVNNHTSGWGAGIGQEFSSSNTHQVINSILYGNISDLDAASADVAVPTSQVMEYFDSIVGARTTVDEEIAENLSTEDPLLGALADNGGPTQTLALLPGSPAIGAGQTGSAIPGDDQRGFWRFGSVDIGAYQVNSFSLSFDANGADAGEPPVYQGETVYPGPNTLTREDFNFAGWNTAADGSGTPYAAGETIVPQAGTTTLFAQWVVAGFTVSFIDWDDTVLQTGTVPAGTAATAPTSPIRLGYSFTGWLPADFTNITADTTITAQYSINQYTLTFNSSGGSPVPAITQNFGSDVDAPPVPVKVGHSFLGWSPAVPETMPAENLSLTAQWSVNAYTLTFDSDGGSPVPAVTQNFGSQVDASPVPVKEGHSFLGWSPAVPETMPAENLTLTAQWSVNQYTLSFDSAGGSAVADASYDFGAPVTVPAAPTREGHSFAGWSPALPGAMPASNVNVTAQWTINQYTLSFDSAGGSEVAAITADYGSAVTVPAAPTREGFVFVGWSPAVPAIMPAGNTTLTAQWSQDRFTVSASLSGEGSITPASQEVNAGQSVSFTLSVPDTAFVQIDSDCAASRSGNSIVTAAIKEDCSIALVVHPAVQSEVDDGSPAGSLETRRFRITGGAGEQVLSAVQQTRSGSTEWLDLTESATLLTQSEDGSYLFSAERTGRYTFEFTDSVSGEQVSISFDVLPYLAFTASSQPVQQDVAAQVRVWLSDEPIDYPVRVELESTAASVLSNILELEAGDKLRKPLLATATTASDGTLRLRSTGLEQALLGTPSSHRLAVQTALPPLALKASAEQDGQQTLVVNRHGGLVYLSADELSGAVATFSWQALDLMLQGDGANISFDPAGLATGRYFVQLTADAGERSGELELALKVIAECPVADCSNTGSSGIPASQNPQASQPNRLPICPQVEGSNRVSQCQGEGALFAEVPNQYQLTLGLFSEQVSWQSGQFGVALTEGSLIDPGYQQVGFVVNLDVIGLESPGESVPIAIPMPAGQSIPANAVWRKLLNGFWQDFVEDDNNLIDSAARNALGNCPGVSSDAWRPGLNEGDACIRLTIEDGGPNDDDGRANGVIRDPGVLALQQTASISFDSAGGSLVADLTALVGSTLTEPAAPEREGYSFVGWSPTFPEVMPAEDVTLTAQWQINQYLIQFDVAGGQTIANLVLDFGAAVSAPTPVRAGYTFMGWSPALPATMPANDVQVTAQWQPSSVTVTSKGGSLGVLSALVLGGLLLVRRSKARLKASCAALCLLPLLALSQEVYVGAQGGIANSTSSGSLASAVERKLNAEGVSGTVTLNSNSDQAYRLFVGYRFNEWLAAELGWLDLGEAQLHYDGLPVNQARATLLAQPQRGRGAELSLVGQLAQHEVWQPYLRLALFDNRSRYLFTGPAAEPVERRAGIRLGLELGLGYQLSSEWQLMAAAAQYDTKHFNTRMVSLGVRYSF